MARQHAIIKCSSPSPCPSAYSAPSRPLNPRQNRVVANPTHLLTEAVIHWLQECCKWTVDWSQLASVLAISVLKKEKKWWRERKRERKRKREWKRERERKEVQSPIAPSPFCTHTATTSFLVNHWPFEYLMNLIYSGLTTQAASEGP